MKTIKLFLIAILAVAIGACGDAATETKNADEKPTTASETNPEKTEETPEKAATEDTPTKAITEFAKAYQEKDLVRVKMRMSGKTLEIMAKDAAAKNAKLDDMVRSFMNTADLPFKGEPEMGKAVIAANTATVEVKADGKWIPMPLVLENDKWRIAFDKGKPGA